MTTEQKLLFSVGILPALRDFLEDSIEDKALRFEAKQRATKVINAIDSFTDFIFKGMDIEAGEQQVIIQNWFLNECNNLIKEA